MIAITTRSSISVNPPARRHRRRGMRLSTTKGLMSLVLGVGWSGGRAPRAHGPTGPGGHPGRQDDDGRATAARTPVGRVIGAAVDGGRPDPVGSDKWRTSREVAVIIRHFEVMSTYHPTFFRRRNCPKFLSANDIRNPNSLIVRMSLNGKGLELIPRPDGARTGEEKSPSAIFFPRSRGVGERIAPGITMMFPGARSRPPRPHITDRGPHRWPPPSRSPRIPGTPSSPPARSRPVARPSAVAIPPGTACPGRPPPR